jgi:AcrR family transcriptional regulator
MVGRTKCRDSDSSAPIGDVVSPAATATARRGRPRSTARGERLTRDQVLHTAIAIADVEGYEAVTLRRMADVLGVHPTSIYNHVPNKEAILQGVIETLLVEADLPQEVPDWQSWIRGVAAAIRRVATGHPGAFTIFLRHTGTGPIAARHVEAALDAFRREGCTVEQAARIVHGVLLAVMGLALEEGLEPTVTPAVAADLTHLSRQEHPRIFEVEDAGLYDASSEPTWDLMVDALIAGFAATMPLGQRTPRRAARRKARA